MRSLVDSVLKTAITIVVAVLLLRWAWNLFRPMVPILVVMAVAILAIRSYIAYRRRW